MIGWLDCSSGASGDMLLGAVLDAGAPLEQVRSAVAAVAPEATTIMPEQVRRQGLAALHARVKVEESTTHRGLPDVLQLIDEATAHGLPPAVAVSASAVFTRLAEAEARVHGTTVTDVHFHELGALDAIADVVGVCAGLTALGLDDLHASPVAVGSGHVETAHGRLSVPPPAVAALLTGIPTYAGPVATELCTPTGAALLAHWVDTWGPQPPMRVQRIGTGAGTKDFPGHPNALRLLIGDATEPSGDLAATATETAVVFETNVDDLDPRLWPQVLRRLLDAGASDAWLTPILMKKGRPAHTLSALLPPERSDDVRRVIVTETSAIGMRITSVAKDPLDREFATVEVDGHAIQVKLALDDGVVVNVQPEYDDVVAAAQRLGRPVKQVLGAAAAAALPLWQRRGQDDGSTA
ncbi:MAG: nickel pincer cofactor biosynthesis protein LarC [Nocardioidaceae bacterium]